MRVEPEQKIEHAEEMCQVKNGLTCRGVDLVDYPWSFRHISEATYKKLVNGLLVVDL